MTSRNHSLDVLRGLAVLMVICSHYHYLPLSAAGWIGVDLFFVLSGFLISGLVFREVRLSGNISLLRFWIRRGFKIYPAFFFFLGLTALLFPSFRPSWKLQAVFLTNYFPLPPQAGGWGHLWSLDVEEHFYFVLPLLLLCLSRLKALRAIPWIAAFLVCACLVLRVQYHLAYGVQITAPTHLRIDALFVGVTLGYLYHYFSENFLRASRWFLLPIAGVFLLPALFDPEANAFRWSVTMTTNLIAFSLLLLWAVPRKIPYTHAIAEIGRHSYSIYLWQMIVVMFYRAHPISGLGFAGYLVTSVAVGTAMAVIVEFPALALREKLVSGFKERRQVASLEESPGVQSGSTAAA